jgi:hypothetical protein
MQRVLDASITVIGEERSLYDLAMNFLSLGKTSQVTKFLQNPMIPIYQSLRAHSEQNAVICQNNY